MEKFLFVAVAAVAAILLFGGGSDPGDQPGTPDQTADANVETDAPPPPNGQFTTSRAPDGHFYADVRINDTPVRMMIDTGATSVILSRRDAQRAGLDGQPQEFTVRASTAGGIIALKPVTIDRMTMGSLSRRNIDALIAEHDLPISLVGQSFLEQVASVEIASGQIRLR